MAEPSGPDSLASLPRCPWCSAELPSRSASTCTSCGAALTGEPDGPLPGVTAIDAEAIVRAARVATPVRRSRLLSWISGDETGDGETPAQPGSLALPSPEVRREMLRLAMEAELSNLQAEVDSFGSVERDSRRDEPVAVAAGGGGDASEPAVAAASAEAVTTAPSPESDAA